MTRHNAASGRATATCVFAVIILIGGTAGGGDNDRNGTSAAAAWRFDVIHLSDGRAISGLIRFQTKDHVELVEVGRQPGRPMYLLVRWIPRRAIARIDGLEPAERQTLQARIDQFRNRTKIAAARRQEFSLSSRTEDGVRYLQYNGPWFSLESTANEALTREALAHLEQMFAGFRTFLRPRIKPARPPRIVLLGTLDQYFDYQRVSNVTIRNPAYFDTRRNEIVAGGQLASFAAKLNDVRQHHQQMLARYKAQEKELDAKLRAMTKKLRADGADDEAIRKFREAARLDLMRTIEPQRIKIRLAERENSQQYMMQFRVLYHEAFHAYLINHVFNAEDYLVPRWLNEGLAQVFETGLLDAGTLRLDAPDPVILEALARDLANGPVMSLAELLTAKPEEFLVGHNDAARQANRLYLYSWGVAYYLTFGMNLLDSDRLDKYLAGRRETENAVQDFEALVDMPLARFEHQWRQFILASADDESSRDVSQRRRRAMRFEQG